MKSILNCNVSFDPTKGLIEPNSHLSCCPDEIMTPELVGAGYRLLKNGESKSGSEIWDGTHKKWYWNSTDDKEILCSYHGNLFRRKIEPDYSSPYYSPIYPTSLSGYKYKMGEEVILNYDVFPQHYVNIRVRILGFVPSSNSRVYVVSRVDCSKMRDNSYMECFDETWLSPISSLEVSSDINGRKVVARKDGTLTVGCTTLSKEEVAQIEALRKKALEA
jgi:hypothetical protein